MINYRKLSAIYAVLFIGIASLIVLLCIVLNNDLSAKPRNTEKSNIVMQCDFYDYEALSLHTANAVPYESCEASIGMTVPHYLPVMQLTANGLSSVQGDDVETVIIIAPNHSGDGAAVQISGDGFYWSAGSIEGDSETAERIQKTDGIRAVMRNEMIEFDHSASIQAPYAKHYFRNAKLVTILVSKGMYDSEISAISNTIADIAKEKRIFIIASIDFSHYQKTAIAAERDKETKTIIESGNTAALRHLTGANLDSPETMAIFMTVCELLNKELVSLDYKLTSFIENGMEQGASYFVYAIK